MPLPGAPGDHQTANARVLERVGAAVLLPDPECTPAGLATVVEELVGDPGAWRPWAGRRTASARPDAAAAGADVVEANARSGGRRVTGGGDRDATGPARSGGR